MKIIDNKNVFVFCDLIETTNHASSTPGQIIASRKKINTNGVTSSMGYGVTSNGKNGFVMSGHGSNVGHYILINGKKIGITRKKQDKETIDASYVEITDNTFKVNNRVEGYPLKSATFNPIIGSNVCKIGYKTGTTCGSVKKINSSWTDKTSGTHYSNISESNYKSAKGDNGGLVYFRIPNLTEYLIVGIHKDGGVGVSHYSKASEINRIFGLKVK